MFEGLQSSTLKRFTWSVGGTNNNDKNYNDDGDQKHHNDTNTAATTKPSAATGAGGGAAEIRVALHVVDEDPGALQSGHYLWPGSIQLAEFLVENYHGGGGGGRRSLSTSTSSSPVLSHLSCPSCCCLRRKPPPNNILELGCGVGLPSLTCLQLFNESLQCCVLTDHDLGCLEERARESYESTLEDLIESTKTEEEQLDCINCLASTPCEFEPYEWGDVKRAYEISMVVSDHNGSSPLLLLEDEEEDDNAKTTTTTTTTITERGRAIGGDPPLLQQMQEQQQQQQQPTNPNHNSERNIFDLILGSDLIYCRSVVEPLLRSVSYFMTPNGTFLLSQSMIYDDNIEDCIDQVCQKLKLERIVLKDTLLPPLSSSSSSTTSTSTTQKQKQQQQICSSQRDNDNDDNNHNNNNEPVTVVHGTRIQQFQWCQKK